MNHRPVTAAEGPIRPLWVGLIVVAGLAALMFFGRQSVRLGDEMEERQKQALATAQAALQKAAGSAGTSSSTAIELGAAAARSAALEQQAHDLRANRQAWRIAFFGTTLLLFAFLGAVAVGAQRAKGRAFDRLAQLAHEDPLTGLPNRRELDEVVPVEFARAQRNGHPLTYVMMDLDFFKKYNDRRGHDAGDALLRGASQAWARQLRPTDLIARYGGEEFSLLLPACDSDQAAALVDRLRGFVPDHQTFSAGVATWDGEESSAELMRRADQALLQAKKAGRNRSMIAGREPQVTLPLQVAAM